MKAIKYIAIAAAALAIAGCSKWTEQEPVEVLYPSLKDKNPALYAQYMESIREYRATEHPVLIAKFDNKRTAPSGRAEHLNCLPDSVDFVILNNPAELSEATIAEMKEIKEEKAVPTLMEIRYDALLKEWENLLADEAEARLEYSFAGRIGKAVEPIIRYAGFDWRIGVGLIGAMTAKEVFVAQMGIVYKIGEVDEDSVPLQTILRNHYSPLVGLCVILFSLVAAPCLATVVVVAKESSFKWALAQWLTLTLIGFFAAVLVYQFGMFLQLGT